MARKKRVKYDRNLKKIFAIDDPEFAYRVARLCVLYEDLRIEFFGARTLSAIREVDQLSKMYRQFYFLRRSLVTLIEFQGALSRINNGKWEKWINTQADADFRRSWKEALAYFNTHCREWKDLRGDIGGHYPEAAARYAVEHLAEGATGILEATYIGDDKIGDFKLHFCTQLIAVALLKNGPAPSNDEDAAEQLGNYLTATFRSLTEGWRQAANAVGVVLMTFVVPRFVDLSASPEPSLNPVTNR